MRDIYEAHEKRVKSQLYQPVYSGEGKTKTIISWIPSEKFCYCKEKEKFRTTQRMEGGTRLKITNGTLETNSLKKDEITLDWKILYDGELYVITDLEQEDDNTQQEYSTNTIVITTLKVRR